MGEILTALWMTFTTGGQNIRKRSHPKPIEMWNTCKRNIYLPHCNLKREQYWECKGFIYNCNLFAILFAIGWTFLKTRCTNCQKVCERMFSITNHHQKANQNAMRYYFQSIKMAIIKKNTENKCRWGCGEIGTIVDCCRDVNRWEPL